MITDIVCKLPGAVLRTDDDGSKITDKRRFDSTVRSIKRLPSGMVKRRRKKFAFNKRNPENVY